MINVKEIYPSFIWSKQRGAILLNASLPEDYHEKIYEFYESGGKDRLEDLAKNISESMQDIFGKTEIKLRWDNKKGLTGISIGPSRAVYLGEYSFVEHNLGTKTQLMATPIIINYINELLKI
jgi:hypothetical protein